MDTFAVVQDSLKADVGELLYTARPREWLDLSVYTHTHTHTQYIYIFAQHNRISVGV